jgi:hypothetical protein
MPMASTYTILDDYPIHDQLKQAVGLPVADSHIGPCACGMERGAKYEG